MTSSSKTALLAIVLATCAHCSEAFVPSSLPQHAPKTIVHSDSAYYFADAPQAFHDEPSAAFPEAPTQQKHGKSSIVKQNQVKKHGKDGVFSPIVVALKETVGEEQINKLRAQVIQLHSKVIGGFVETAESAFGQNVLRQLFELADRNRNGQIEEDELRTALRTLGFDWLKEKQVKGIFKRADKDANGAIDLEEWMLEAPKTLKTNLIKLAKKNGTDMGLLV